MSANIDFAEFSVKLFQELWFQTGIIQCRKSYGYSPLELDHLRKIVHLFYYRHLLFKNTLLNIITPNYKTFTKSGEHFYLFLQDTIDEVYTTQTMSVFYKLSISFCFLHLMSDACRKANNSMYLYYAPLSWTIFFDKELKRDFYFNGGFEKLAQLTYNPVKFITFYRAVKDFLQYTDDLEAVKAMFEFILKDRISSLGERFLAKMEERRNSSILYCMSCKLKMNVFYCMQFPCKDKLFLIEGYFQIILRLLTFTDFNNIYQQNIEGVDSQSFERHLDEDEFYNDLIDYILGNNSCVSKAEERNDIFNENACFLCLEQIPISPSCEEDELEDDIRMINSILQDKKQDCTEAIHYGDVVEQIDECSTKKSCETKSDNADNAYMSTSFTENDILRMFPVCGFEYSMLKAFKNSMTITSEKSKFKAIEKGREESSCENISLDNELHDESNSVSTTQPNRSHTIVESHQNGNIHGNSLKKGSNSDDCKKIANKNKAKPPTKMRNKSQKLK